MTEQEERDARAGFRALAMGGRNSAGTAGRGG